MKKSLIAFGASLACLAGAHAQSSVQVTGLVDMYAGSMKQAGAQRTAAVNSGGMSTSWWGLSGTEDLGQGLKAGFNLGAFLRGDTGAMGRFDGDTFFARDANVSLSGSFGAVKLGRSSAPNFLPSVFANPFGDSFTVSPLIIHANMSKYSYQDNSYNFNTTPADTGWSNQIVYSSPSFGGLTFNVQYQFGEVATANSKKNVGVTATYRSGGLMLTGFFERAQANNPGAGLLDGSFGSRLGTTQDWMLGGSYDFGAVKVYGTYGEAETKDNNSYKGKTFSLGLDVPVSKAGTLKVAAAQTKLDVRAPSAFDGKRTTATVGYDHFLSKRTDVYTAVMHDRVTHLKSGTSVALGIRHRF